LEISARPTQDSQQHFPKEMEIMKSNQVEMLEMKISINQIKTTVDIIISRQDEAEERISETENKIEDVLHVNNHKEKNAYDYNIK
jgi:hypothetical protein